MNTARPPAVADMFYPGRPAVLRHDVEEMLDLARRPEDASAAPPKALIVPHAGYVYSGPIAARAYARLARHAAGIRRVVLMGPAHRVAVPGLAASGLEAFLTPLGRVPVDTEALASLTDLPQVGFSDTAHAMEHSLEVQLPFLQTVLGEFSLLPFAVGRATPAHVAEVLDRLWGGPETLVVISSDLSHYHRYADAQVLDRATADAILRLDTRIDHEHACGATPVAGLLVCARRRGLKPELLDLRNSGDTAGDRARVVGYAAFAFTETRAGEADHVH